MGKDCLQCTVEHSRVTEMFWVLINTDKQNLPDWTKQSGRQKRNREDIFTSVFIVGKMQKVIFCLFLRLSCNYKVFTS